VIEKLTGKQLHLWKTGDKKSMWVELTEWSRV